VSSFITAGDSSKVLVIGHSDELTLVAVKGQAQAIIRGYAKVTTEENTLTQLITLQASISGSGEVRRITSSNPIEWCKVFDLPIEGEYVTLYKALDKDFCSRWRNFCYLPGTTVEAPDWDPNIECGGGLHFSPSPRMAKEFNPAATKFVACKVKLSEVLVHPEGVYPEKVKAPRVYEIFEVDIEGNRL
jgi:hypothetical protein